jgi:hypothetical protein
MLKIGFFVVATLLVLSQAKHVTKHRNHPMPKALKMALTVPQLIRGNVEGDPIAVRPFKIKNIFSSSNFRTVMW